MATTLVADGDSITAGQGVAAAQRYGDVAIATRTMSYNYLNTGVPGQRCDQADTAASSLGGADSYLSSHLAAVATLSIQCGANDLFQGASEAITIARILTYVANRKSAGWKNVIVFTVADMSSISESSRAALNSDIIADAGANGYTVANVGSDANIGCNGCDTNSTYFQSDHIHPNATGQGVWATYLESALTALSLN